MPKFTADRAFPINYHFPPGKGVARFLRSRQQLGGAPRPLATLGGLHLFIISGVGSFTLRARPNNSNALITQYVGSDSNRESPTRKKAGAVDSCLLGYGADRVVGRGSALVKAAVHVQCVTGDVGALDGQEADAARGLFGRAGAVHRAACTGQRERPASTRSSGSPTEVLAAWRLPGKVLVDALVVGREKSLRVPERRGEFLCGSLRASDAVPPESAKSPESFGLWPEQKRRTS
jgi:hypothetical protein